MLSFGDNGLLSMTSDVRDDVNSDYVDKTLDLAYISVDAEYVTQSIDDNRVKYYSEGGQGKTALQSYLSDRDIEVVGYGNPTTENLKIKLNLSYNGNTYEKELDIVDPALNDINIAAYASDIASRGFTINTAIGSALDVTKISYSIDSGKTFTDTTEQSHTFTGLTPDTTYYVRVTAENEAGDTSETGIIEVTTKSDIGSASGSSTRYLYDRYTYTTTYSSTSNNSNTQVKVGEAYNDGSGPSGPGVYTQTSYTTPTYANFSFNSSNGTYTGVDRYYESPGFPYYVVESDVVYEITKENFIANSANTAIIYGTATKTYSVSKKYNKIKKVGTVSSSKTKSQIEDSYYNVKISQDSIDPLYITFDEQKVTAGNTIELKIWQNDGAKK